MSAEDFYECMLYDQMEPFGGPRGDLQAGVIASVIANVNRDPKKKTKPWSPVDFMLFTEKPGPEKQSPKAFRDALMAIATHKPRKKK